MRRGGEYLKVSILLFSLNSKVLPLLPNERVHDAAAQEYKRSNASPRHVHTLKQAIAFEWHYLFERFLYCFLAVSRVYHPAIRRRCQLHLHPTTMYYALPTTNAEVYGARCSCALFFNSCGKGFNAELII